MNIVRGLPTALKSAIPMAVKADKKDDRFNLSTYLQGVYFHLNTGAVAVATDGKRMRKLLINSEVYHDTSGVIPKECIDAIQKFSGNVGLEVADGMITVMDQDSGASTTHELIKGDYPDYQSVIDNTAGHEIKAVVNRLSLFTALGMVLPIGHKLDKNKHHPIGIHVWDNTMTVSYSTYDNNSVIYRGMYRIPVKSSGWIFSLFNYFLLLDSLRTISDEQVTLRFHYTPDISHPEAMRIEYRNGIDLIMPMAIQVG